MNVLGCRGDHWNIELETKTLDHGMLPYQVELSPNRKVKFWTKNSGVTVEVLANVLGGPTPGQADIIYSMYLDVTGIPALLISEKSLREKQEHMVAVTLGDFDRAAQRH
ncbi:MAG: hypothetical protein FWD69_03475 [Polyangiaceae bacterium]|nr:hypothetical protein [Polyangiaceae bacterium]